MNVAAFLIFLMPFAVIVLLVWLKSRERITRDQMQADLYSKIIEKEQSIPSLPLNLFEQREKLGKRKRNVALNSGLICMAIGVGISLCCWIISIVAGQMSQGSEMASGFLMFASIGIIPFMIGIAFVIIHIIQKRESISEVQ